MFPHDGFDQAYRGTSGKHAVRLTLRGEITAQETYELRTRINKS
jgi:hypothetical protein